MSDTMNKPRPASAAKAAPARRRGVSLRDVAREAGVSVATVSMVLNANPRISRGTQDRVRAKMRELGYQPNRLAQSLSGKYTKCLAVLLPMLRHAFADAYFGELLSGVCDAAHEAGHKVLLEQAKDDYLAAGKHRELYERRYVDGVLLLGTSDRHSYVSDLRAVGCPAVVVDNRLDGADSVASDYAGGARQAMNYLRQLGHERIGLLTAGSDTIATARDVRDVWREGTSTPGLVGDGYFTEEGGAEAVAGMLAAEPGMTAVLAMNDKMAVGAMAKLKALGRGVPGDVSVVGFDDLRQASFVTPSLTTIHLPLYEVGAAATRGLIDRVKGRAQPLAEVHDVKLVIRGSTGRPKEA